MTRIFVSLLLTALASCIHLLGFSFATRAFVFDQCADVFNQATNWCYSRTHLELKAFYLVMTNSHCNLVVEGWTTQLRMSTWIVWVDAWIQVCC